jgi:hypothetical protein
MLPAGAFGTPTIDEIQAEFEMYNKPNNEWSAITIIMLPGRKLSFWVGFRPDSSLINATLQTGPVSAGS